LLAHCETPWLLTLPVDLVGVNDCLLPSLIAGSAQNGAFAIDDDGPQPLVALWRVAAAAIAARGMLEAGQTAVHVLQTRLGLPGVRFDGVRFGNLNTPDDLRAAGIRHD
jgi:molybdopterin-guanine dinucleotide biosynthesis protein A